VAEYVERIARGGTPLPVDEIRGPHQLRLLRAGVMVVCPLLRRRLEATVLLGARRGWIYDTATMQALKLFGAQAGLALENVALAGARAHADKLAALGEAAARIAHEIRNPLTAARSLVQQAQSADGVAELADPALEELDRIGRLVSDLLAFARRDEPPVRQPLPLAAVCQQAVKQVTPLAAAAGVEVSQATGDAVVSGDHTRLVQVVANLCRNAIEALAEQGAPRRVDVSCRALNGHGVIEVRDNGPGVAVHDRQRLFEPFATTKSAGTGLGLPIARRIVEAPGGRLSVESEPGVATVFRVELPLGE
jgi:signal transduction histidine kinase